MLLVGVWKLLQELKHGGVRVDHRDSVIEFRVYLLYFGDSCGTTDPKIVLKRRFLYDLTEILILRCEFHDWTASIQRKEKVPEGLRHVIEILANLQIDLFLKELYI